MTMFHVKHCLLAALLAGAAASASAQKVYRCVSPKGGTTFSEMPCITGQGGEITIRPSGGGTGNTSKVDSQNRVAMDRRTAEMDALISPECRRARQAYQTKSEEKGGLDELSKEGNAITQARNDCQPAVDEAIRKLHTKDLERTATEARKPVEQAPAAPAGPKTILLP
jgi:hypothetical protein